MQHYLHEAHNIILKKEDILHFLNPDTQLEETDKVLMFNKSKLHPLGKYKVKIRNPRNQKSYRLEFQVVNQNCDTALLGRK